MDFSFFDSIKNLEEELSSLDEEISEVSEHGDAKEDTSKSISSYSSRKLCEIIVSYRYLGLNKALAISAMNELGSRRDSGDPTNFENEIELMLSELPQIDFKIPDLRNIFSTKIKI